MLSTFPARSLAVLLVLPALVTACSRDDSPTGRNNLQELAPHMPAHIHHAIDYIEFTVTDMAESKRFYAAAFGWEFTDYGPEYAGIRKQDGEAGGLRLHSEVTTGGPLVILFSENLEATLSRVRKAGGRIITEPFAFPGGRRFHFSDPSGTELAVWSEH